ncbi:hypothetical protein CJ030_MR6G024811 [Morella rubra]|uniref:Uncharacterized protein n=1 Tax=Morella rubra TaxID=262757 RepID=A0A6A1V8K4_9ROSI|nr:hypothetical protein CJ030_MR6G024811 [Morella rubra]
MREVPSLISLCIEAVKNELVQGGDIVTAVFELPYELFDPLLSKLPPLALQKLQSEMPFEDQNDHEFADDCFTNGRKRARFRRIEFFFFFQLHEVLWSLNLFSRDYVGEHKHPNNGNFRFPNRHWNFDSVWRGLFKLRWPDLVVWIQPVDWQQIYWETHLQDCLDEAAEIALIPSFNGCIGDIQLPDLGFHLSFNGVITCFLSCTWKECISAICFC